MGARTASIRDDVHGTHQRARAVRHVCDPRHDGNCDRRGKHISSSKCLSNARVSFRHTAWQVSYTVSDNLSVSYGAEEHSKGVVSSTNTEFEGERAKVTYTAGGMTLTASTSTGDNVSFGTATTEDREVWALGASFAF